jgi:hypothetical protein
MAEVFSTHFEGLKTKAGSPASDLKRSNSTTLNFGLYIFSHVPRNYRVVRVRIRFLITSAARLASVRAFAISVRQM